MVSVAVYRLAIWLYTLAVHIASAFNPKAKLFVQGRKRLLQKIRYALVDEMRPRIWMHCASLGEFEQGRPLLEALRKQYPQYAYVVTFFSPSGYEVRKNYSGADYIFYLPMDGKRNSRRFLQMIQPKLAIFVKYELWYYYLKSLADRDVPTLLVSAVFRKDQAFFKWYGRLHRRMLHCFSHIFVQNKASLQLIERLGVEHATVCGDTRFDRVIEIQQNKNELPQLEAFSRNGKVLVAGSSWPQDESFLKQVMDMLPKDWKLVLVPHEIHDTHITDIKKLFEDAAMWDDDMEAIAAKRVLIVNKMGLLTQIYRYADAAWVGGGFGKDGIHNTLEAAVYGIPVGFGPVHYRHAEAQELINEGGAITTDSPKALAEAIKQWDKDRFSYEAACSAAAKYVHERAGATSTILDYLEAKKVFTAP